MLRQRALTAAVGIPVTLLVIYAGGWWLVGAAALLSVLALRELYRMTLRHWPPWAARLLPVFSSVRWAGYGLAIALPAAHVQVLLGGREARFAELILASTLVLTGVAAAAARVLPAGHPARLTHAWVTCLGTLYLPALFSYLVRLRALGEETDALRGLDMVIPSGIFWLLLVFATCWTMDTAAYGVGRKWGKRKLCPTVSPGKTVEGSIAALMASVFIVCGLGWWFGLPLWQGLLLGMILGVVGQLGDLAESKLKRWAGVKDSGAMLPGHGGVLDRFDSLLFNAPVAYYYLWYVVGH